MLVLFTQIKLLPLIEAGAGSVLDTITARDEAGEVPQKFVPSTVIVPPVLLAVTVIALVVLVPIQPEGNVQL